MEIKKIKISQINPAPYNPRADLKPHDPTYEKLKHSMVNFGYVEPIVWNCRTGNLVGGHQRFKILLEQGVNEVEVSIVSLPLQKEKALNLALNKIQGEWSQDKLAVLLEELTKMPDFDATLAGFDPPEISEILDNYNEPTEDDDFDFEAAIESTKELVVGRGDLIQLGPHRILCGDSSVWEDLKLLMGNEKTHLIYTDPPYNVSYYGGNRPHPDARPKKSRNWKRIYADNMNQEEYEVWLKGIFTNMAQFLMPGAPIYIWNGHRQFGPMHEILIALDFHVADVITWAKQNFAISYGDYNQQTEFCLYGWKKENGPHLWCGPTNETTLWQIKRDVTKNYIHPTQKPIALAQRAIKNSSKRGDVVLDLFLGSGSTLIAAESLGRRCFGIEIDPKYCDGIIHRYISFVGKDKVSEEIKKRYLKGEDNEEQRPK